MDDETMNTGEQMEAAAPVANESEDSGAEQSQGGHPSQNVPLDALQAERAERQRLQDELKMIKDHISLMQVNQQSSQPDRKDDFDGMSDDDVLTVGELKKALGQKEQQFQMSLQELRMTQKYPDYQETITKYLPDVIKQNPSLRDSLQKTQDYELAYYLARNSDSYKQEHKKVKRNEDAERMVQNANQVGTLSSVGNTSPMSQARRYKEMSDADFEKMVNKNLGYF